MTDKQRITEILIAYTKKHKIMASHVILEAYAEELVANGVIAPPCKVGDILFCIFSDKSIDKVYMHIEACRVTDIMYFASDSFVFGVREINCHYNHNVVLGENAFKTFEEAEAKLKEIGNNE